MLKSKIENKGARTTYIRKKKSKVWHWHPACLHFKRHDGGAATVEDERTSRPGYGELCSLCVILEKRDRDED